MEFFSTEVGCLGRRSLSSCSDSKSKKGPASSPGLFLLFRFKDDSARLSPSVDCAFFGSSCNGIIGFDAKGLAVILNCSRIHAQTFVGQSTIEKCLMVIRKANNCLREPMHSAVVVREVFEMDVPLVEGSRGIFWIKC